MEEDPDGPLGATQDPGDLGGRHLVDEAQDDGPAAVVVEPGDGPPGRRGLGAHGPRRPRRRPGAGTARAASSAACGRRRRACAGARRWRCGRSGTARPGTSTRPRRRPAGALLEARQVGQGRQERPLGRVLRLVRGRAARRPRSCTPGPRTSDTGRRTAPGPPAPPPRARDRGRDGRAAGARPPPAVPPFLNAGRAIALHPDPWRRRRRRRTWPDLADDDGPLAVGAAGVLDDQGAAGGIDAEGADDLGSSRPGRSGPRRGRSSAGARSSRRRRSGRRAAPRCGPRAGPGTRRAARRGRSAGRATASRSEVIVSARSGGKSAGGPVRVDADADDDPRVVRARGRRSRRGRRPACARPSASAGGASGTAEPDGLDDEVVRPLQADRPVGQPGDLLGGIGHRQRDRGGQPPGRGPASASRPEAERQQQRGAGRRDPRPAVAAATGGLLVGDGQADLRRARRPASRGRRRWSSRRWRSAPGG